MIPIVYNHLEVLKTVCINPFHFLSNHTVIGSLEICIWVAMLYCNCRNHFTVTLRFTRDDLSHVYSSLCLLLMTNLNENPKKTATCQDAISGFPTNEIWATSTEIPYCTDNMSLPWSGQCFWLATPDFLYGMANQKHYPDLGWWHVICVEFLCLFRS